MGLFGKKVGNGNHVFVQGQLFGPGAEIFCPTRGVVPPIVITGTGYIPTNWGINPIQGPQVMQPQQAALQGVGVVNGNFGKISPLAQDNSTNYSQAPNNLILNNQ